MAKPRSARQGHGKATHRKAMAWFNTVVLCAAKDLHSMDIHSGAAAWLSTAQICFGKAIHRIGMSLFGNAE